MTDEHRYVVSGRCRSGKRWFWMAGAFDHDATRQCDCPLCPWIPGPHKYGWVDTEVEAFKQMFATVLMLGGEADPPRTYYATHALKLINAAKRRARPAANGNGAGPTEYLYGRWLDEDCRRHIYEYRIARKTPKRIYYVAREAAHGRDAEIGYVDRETLERDGEVRNRGRHWFQADYHLYATRELADPPREEDDEPNAKELKLAAAAVHPDRGGTKEEFVAAYQRYERARKREAMTAA